MNEFSDKEKQLFWNLPIVSCSCIDNLQPPSFNIKLLQCYGIFLMSLKLTCAFLLLMYDPFVQESSIYLNSHN